MKTNITIWLQAFCVGFMLGGMALLSAGCVGVAYTEPGPGVYYGYEYYPGVDVYYYPRGHIYYWNEGGHWRWGARLPPAYHLRGEHHDYLRLHGRQPWTAHRPGHVEQPGHY